MATGAGDRMDGVVDETRTRSRSPRGDPGAEHAGAPDGTGDTVPEVNLPVPDGGTAVPDLDLPIPEGAAQAESATLTAQLTQCLNKLQGVSFELSAAVDGFSDAHDKLREEVGKLGLKLEKQSHALTTVGASLAAETNEVGKLLKAFDKFASNFRWSFSGKHSVEENLGFLQARIVEQKGELEASLLGALTSISGLLEQIRQNTARESVPPPPHFPPPAPDTGVGVPMPMDAGASDVGGDPLAAGSTLLPGYASGPGSHAVASPAVAPPPAPQGSCMSCEGFCRQRVGIDLLVLLRGIGGRCKANNSDQHGSPFTATGDLHPGQHHRPGEGA